MVLKLIVPHKKPLLIIKIKMYFCLFNEISIFLTRFHSLVVVLVKTIIQSTNQGNYTVGGLMKSVQMYLVL